MGLYCFKCFFDNLFKIILNGIFISVIINSILDVFFEPIAVEDVIFVNGLQKFVVKKEILANLFRSMQISAMQIEIAPEVSFNSVISSICSVSRIT